MGKERAMGKRQAMAFLDELEAKGIRLGLSRIKRFLRLIGSPERQFKSIHIAGTNGKGSTCAMVESILREAGCKTGLYTSPHLVEFNERIRVNGKSIGDAQLARLVAETRELADKSGISLTYFEFVTAMAFRHFASCGVEIAVIEVGMGGRLDATNVLLPLVSVITNVSREHEQWLGYSLEKIALEKAGVIKEGVPVLTAEWKSSVLSVFKGKCRQLNASLVVVKKPFAGRLGLLGFFQHWNAALALAVVAELQKQGVAIQDSSVRDGLAKVEWPGRFQIIQVNPTLLLDCAHNPACCVVLSRAFSKMFPKKKALVVFGVSSDKNAAKMAELLVPVSKKVFVTNARFRAMPFERVEKAFSCLGVCMETVPGVSNAVKKALSEAGKHGIVLVSGSCFVVGEALESFGKTG